MGLGKRAQTRLRIRESEPGLDSGLVPSANGRPVLLAFWLLGWCRTCGGEEEQRERSGW